MIPQNVTLIVKAPNQQIEDQNIECESSWTVRQLKGHLSEVYPNKPRTEEQKIIYSGQLLDDNTILKDVLRTYESQIAHTMHLVCTPSRRMPEPARSQTAPDSDGLRRRNVEPREETVPHESQNVQNHTVEMQNYLNSAMNNYGRVPPYPNYNFEQMPAQDPASAANQMLVMQQAYMQYMQQYAVWQASVRAEQPPPAPAPPPAEPPAEAEAEDAQPRDWLDHLYAASRLAILSSLIYLYGSGARLLLVIVLAVAGYLHQIGFFRELNLNGNLRNRNQQDNQPDPQGNQPNPQGNQPNPQGNQLNPQGNQPNPQGNQPTPQGNQPTATEANGNQPEPEDDRSLWSVTWMIFTTFFSSLIPDANHQ